VLEGEGITPSLRPIDVHASPTWKRFAWRASLPRSGPSCKTPAWRAPGSAQLTTWTVGDAGRGISHRSSAGTCGPALPPLGLGVVGGLAAGLRADWRAARVFAAVIALADA